MKNAKFSLSQILWFFAGVTLFIGGFLSLLYRGALTDIASTLGFIMLFAGLINILIYYYKGKEMYSSRWLFADGLTTALLSLFPLFSQEISPDFLPLFFGLWELFSGVLKTIDSQKLKKESIKFYKGFSAVGFMELISGILSMIRPLDDFLGAETVVAINLFVQGLGVIFKV
ncbi:MAG: hypothetical protein IKC07_03050, partial [Clostridia bacterium]|nr:hypothetical protein [Clostridia bacterium]